MNELAPEQPEQDLREIRGYTVLAKKGVLTPFDAIEEIWDVLNREDPR